MQVCLWLLNKEERQVTVTNRVKFDKDGQFVVSAR